MRLHGSVLVALFWLPLLAQISPISQQLEAEARQRLAARDPNGALALYEKLAQLVPKSAVYQDDIGFLLAATKRTPEAIPHFERATLLDPKMAQAWYHLGVARLISGDAARGIDDLRKAVALAPDHAEYPFRLGSAYNDAGRYAQAVPELTKASKQLPRDARVWEALGLALQKQSDPQSPKRWRRILRPRHRVQAKR